MAHDRKIIHIDMDAFFASVEQLDNPGLRGRPVIVGGAPNSRGVVAACSYEARRYGVHSAMPSSQAAKLCPQAVFIRGRMSRYKEISHQIMEIFTRYTDLIEPLSVDEAYLDVTTNHFGQTSATRLAETIRSHIKKETRLTASAGVSYNKFLAKMASALRKPNGLSVITPQNAIAFLDSLAIGKFYGVGHATEKKMLQIGIQCGKDLRQFSREDLIFHFGKSGSYFYDIVRGHDLRPVTPGRVRKSIGSETTLSQDTLDMNEITGLLAGLAEKIAFFLKARNCCAHTVTLKVRYHDFETITRSVTDDVPVSTMDQILQKARQLIPATQLGRRKVRLLGISLSKLLPDSKRRPVQLKLPFMDEKVENISKIK